MSESEVREMNQGRHIKGHYFPGFHPGWGGFSEELFHYTSRYYGVTEAFLRGLAERPGFSMSGYKAASLSDQQRIAMAAILSRAPARETGLGVVTLAEAVIRGVSDVAEELLQQFQPEPLASEPVETLVGHAKPQRPLDIEPLEPWLSLAERLLMPVAVHEHHVEVDMQQLAKHLDSPNPAIRSNLRQTILDLHEAGYLLRNHPHLTHAEAQQIGDEGAV